MAFHLTRSFPSPHLPPSRTQSLLRLMDAADDAVNKVHLLNCCSQLTKNLDRRVTVRRLAKTYYCKPTTATVAAPAKQVTIGTYCYETFCAVLRYLQEIYATNKLVNLTRTQSFAIQRCAQDSMQKEKKSNRNLFILLGKHQFLLRHSHRSDRIGLHSGWRVLIGCCQRLSYCENSSRARRISEIHSRILRKLQPQFKRNQPKQFHFDHLFVVSAAYVQRK